MALPCFKTAHLQGPHPNTARVQFDYWACLASFTELSVRLLITDGTVFPFNLYSLDLQRLVEQESTEHDHNTEHLFWFQAEKPVFLFFFMKELRQI